MTFVQSETRTSRDKNGNRTSKIYEKYNCCKASCQTEVIFQRSAAYNNPYFQIRSCYAKGKSLSEQDRVLRELFEQSRNAAKKHRGTIRSHFDVNSLSDYDKAMYDYIRIIIMKNLALGMCEDTEMRDFSKYDVNLSRKTVTEVIIQLIELVEIEIAEETKETKGAILYDGWTRNEAFCCHVFIILLAANNRLKWQKRNYISCTPDSYCTVSHGKGIKWWTIWWLSR